ncbi:MAG TPA: DUF1697 domain-containing protein [Tepidisphaeraceae bacterium]|jgi:uncharacterized protein (DUF1697 family)|nr:DUF1697 domain-containing protein [Tepidisphaeraceae bacterium]
MPTHFALLRGINVGGNILKMDHLKEIWLELGFKNARTCLQSGNVVFDATKPSAEKIQRRLISETRLPVTVILRTTAEMAQIVAGNPFLPDKADDASHLHVTFLKSEPAEGDLQKLGQIRTGDDRLKAIGKEIYLYCPGGYGRTRLSNNAMERALGIKATTRNWNTTRKLAEMASA